MYNVQSYASLLTRISNAEDNLPLFSLLGFDSSSISTGLFAFDNIAVLAVVLVSTPVS